MPYAVQCIDLVYTIKTVISCQNWNNLEGLESTGSQASAPLNIFEIPAGCCPLTPSFPYLLLCHKIILDFISGKGVNFKASSPHIFSRMSHICCHFTDMVPRRNCYLTKIVNLSTPSMQIWPNKINVDRMITAAYHPQTNGLDER